MLLIVSIFCVFGAALCFAAPSEIKFTHTESVDIFSEKSDLADGTFTAHEFLIPNIEDSRNNDGIVVFYKSTRLDGGVYEVEFKVDEEGFRVVGGAVIVEPARGKAAVVDFGADSRERLSFYPYTPYGDVALRLSVPAPLSRKELVDALRKEYQSEIENLKVR